MKNLVHSQIFKRVLKNHGQKTSTLTQKLKFEETIRNWTFGHNLGKNENLLLLNSSLKQIFFLIFKKIIFAQIRSF